MQISPLVKQWLALPNSSRLMRLAAVFLGLYALALTLAPAVRERSISSLGQLNWLHWLGLAAWLLAFFFLHRQLRRHLPDHDRLLVPVVALLSGWGLLSIWRLTRLFGLRQSLWVLVCAALVILALHLKDNLLDLLRRYKYLWLLAGFLITGLTFFFGTNPSGIGPELWLGCCGIYFQPSEPLKLLLIIYLAAYLADRQPLMTGLLPLLAPTALMTGGALLLLLGQRDLGTAWVFIFIYTVLIYAASGQRRVLLASLLALVLALFAGYELFALVHQRVEAWLNPWADPSGGAYQIVQALLAVAAGGILGRGPGLGSPGFVPVAHSDFIYTSIVEESGLLGSIALLLLISILTLRALRIALHARDAYQRYLAIGLAAYIATQSLLIIGGTIRMLPLTGLPLPFVSYGGSSMLTSFFALLLLALISHNSSDQPPAAHSGRPILVIAAGLAGAFALAALATGWWSLVRGPDLLTRNDNGRRAQADLYVPRGGLLARDGELLSQTVGEAGDYRRSYLYPEFSSVLGYSHPNFGQVGLEAGLDAVLRGEEYQPTWALWFNHMLYGQPAPGQDVRLSLDLALQRLATEQLAGISGALVLLDNDSGQVLAMASAPGYDANRLTEQWEALLTRQDLPLLNRATQGAYPPGTALGPLLLAAARSEGVLPGLPGEVSYKLGEQTLECLRPPNDAENWASVVAAACPGPLSEIGLALGAEDLLTYFKAFGFYAVPDVRTAAYAQTAPTSINRPGVAAIGQSGLLVSPLQMARAAAALSNFGSVPAPQLVLSVEHDGEPVAELEPLGANQGALDNQWAANTAMQLQHPSQPIWQLTASALDEDGRSYTWYLAGSLPDEGFGAPNLTLVVLLEGNQPGQAETIGQRVLFEALDN